MTTTLGADLLPTRHLWKAAHARWDIENDHFSTLATNWHLNHCFKHTPTAILNFILTLYIAFLLVQTFYLRNLKPPLHRGTGTPLAHPAPPPKKRPRETPPNPHRPLSPTQSHAKYPLPHKTLSGILRTAEPLISTPAP